MRRALISIIFSSMLLPLLLVTANQPVMAAGNRGYLVNAHCATEWVWSEKSSYPTNSFGYIIFQNTSDIYAQCTSITVELRYYRTCGLAVCLDTLVDTVRPGDYPYSEKSYTASVYKSPAICAQVRFNVRVHGTLRTTGWMQC